MKILVPTDFTSFAGFGVNVAITLAKALQAEIILLNLLEPPQGTTFAVTGDVTKMHSSEEDRYVAELYRVNKAKLHAIAEAHSTDGVKITPVIKMENLQEGMENFMKETPVDLVVMGTSGESTFTEYFVGNHTERVIRISHVPVLTVKNDHPNLNIKNIVLASDLDEASDRGVKQINKLAVALGAKIHLLHVSTSKNDSEKETLDKLTHFAKTHGLKDYAVRAAYNDSTTDGIKEFAQSSQADLIAVMTHARSGLANIVIGSVSESMVKKAQLPVLTVNLED